MLEIWKGKWKRITEKHQFIEHNIQNMIKYVQIISKRGNVIIQHSIIGEEEIAFSKGIDGVFTLLQQIIE